MLPLVALSGLSDCALHFEGEEGGLCTSLATPHACPGCYPSIGMAADATFPCTTTDSRVSLASFRFQSESSATRSVAPANRPLVARGARHLNVISLCKDSHLRPSRPSGSDGDRRATIVCHPDPADSKYHRSRKPRAMSYLGAQSLPQRRCPGKPAPCTLLLLRRCSPTHCITFGRLWCTTRLRDHLCETLGLSY